MNTYVFGKDIVRTLFPIVDGKPFSLPSQSPTIYVFDAQPTLAEAAAGTDAIATITAWVQSEVSPYTRRYTIPAIDDPDTDSATYCKTYWESLQYRTQLTEQMQLTVRSFEVERVQSIQFPHGASKLELVAFFPAIIKYVDDTQLDEFLGLAEEQMRRDLEKRGYDWAQIKDHRKLKLPLIYKTIALVASSQIRDPQDRFVFRYNEFKSMYESEMSSIVLEYDGDRDGAYEQEAQGSLGYWIVDT